MKPYGKGFEKGTFRIADMHMEESIARSKMQWIYFELLFFSHIIIFWSVMFYVLQGRYCTWDTTLLSHLKDFLGMHILQVGFSERNRTYMNGIHSLMINTQIFWLLWTVRPIFLFCSTFQMCFRLSNWKFRSYG